MVTRVPFERGRTDLAKPRMATSLVIEHLDVIEQLHLRLAVGGEVLGELPLHCREETFHHCIVVAVATPAHAAGDAPPAEYSIGEHAALSSATGTIASAFFMTTSEAHSTRGRTDES